MATPAGMDVNRIIHGDALDVLRGLPDASVDAIITDPPYGVGKAEWDNEFPTHWIEEAWRVTPRMLVCTGLTYLPQFIEALGRYHDLLAVYIVNGMTRSRIGFQNWFPVVACGDWKFQSRPTLFTSRIQGVQYAHPSQKPLDAMTKIMQWYTEPGDLVLDPFAGSGTTLVAARNLQRRYIGVELQAEYVEVARKRLSEMYTLPMFDRAASGED